MLRRLAASLVMLLTLNVGVAEALRVCAAQPDHDHGAAQHETAHEHHQAPAPAESPDGDSDAPAPLTCCNAVSSCGTTLAVDCASDESGVMPGAGELLTGSAAAPLALERAPEPPPPKG